MSIRSSRLHFDETQCWLRFRAGDGPAFAVLFERYSPVLLRYGLSVVPDRDFVKDCIQDLFVELWRSRETVGEAQSVRVYLVVSLRRLMLRHKDSSRRQADLHQALRHDPEGRHEDSPEQCAILDEHAGLQQRYLQQEVGLLPARQREALFLRFYEEMSYEEISGVMELNYQVVRNMVHRAMKNLRVRLESHRHDLLPAAYLLAFWALFF